VGCQRTDILTLTQVAWAVVHRRMHHRHRTVQWSTAGIMVAGMVLTAVVVVGRMVGTEGILDLPGMAEAGWADTADLRRCLLRQRDKDQDQKECMVAVAVEKVRKIKAAMDHQDPPRLQEWGCRRMGWIRTVEGGTGLRWE